MENIDSAEVHNYNQNSYEQNLMDYEDIFNGLLKLFVGGLNYLSLQSDIKSYFETFGKVTNCALLIGKGSGKSRGFAFVTLEDIGKLFLRNKSKNFLIL